MGVGVPVDLEFFILAVEREAYLMGNAVSDQFRLQIESGLFFAD